MQNAFLILKLVLKLIVDIGVTAGAKKTPILEICIFCVKNQYF